MNRGVEEWIMDWWMRGEWMIYGWMNRWIDFWRMDG